MHADADRAGRRRLSSRPVAARHDAGIRDRETGEGGKDDRRVLATAKLPPLPEPDRSQIPLDRIPPVKACVVPGRTDRTTSMQQCAYLRTSDATGCDQLADLRRNSYMQSAEGKRVFGFLDTYMKY
jgi:hypothetical protein